MFSGLHEECGLFGICGDGDMKPSLAAFYGLFALQHRGQESAGIAVSDMGVIDGYKNMGLVGDVFDDERLSKLNGQMAIGHVRYSTAGCSAVENSQPLIMRYAKGRIALAHNGNLINADDLREEFSRNGAMFQTSADSEILAYLIARERIHSGSIEAAMRGAMKYLRGAYSVLIMSPRKIVAVRDPFGFRPLILGKLGDSYVFASETSAFDAIGARAVRDVEPGEIVVVDADGLRSIKDSCTGERRLCVFEYIYFARPDSVIDGVEVHASRRRAGELLARQHPVDADLVIGVPDSGLDAAIGYAKESGITYGLGFVRNNYVGRTFIKPVQSQRRASVDIKLNVTAKSVCGKRVVMVDDSIVRGSTSANIIHMLKAAGAAEVHVRIASPTIHYPCFYGTDIPTREELAANRNTVDEICRLIGADSLGFLSVESLRELAGGCSGGKNYCDACFTGDYPQVTTD